jgi:hypothetical protein
MPPTEPAVMSFAARTRPSLVSLAAITAAVAEIVEFLGRCLVICCCGNGQSEDFVIAGTQPWRS